MYEVDHTHDSKMDSWVESANEANTDFPIQNLPFCIFQKTGLKPSIGVGIGDQILSLRVCAELGLLDDRWVLAASQASLNDLMSLSADFRRDLRHTISGLLFSQTTADREALEKAMFFQTDVTFNLPCVIGDYSDFYASIYHATNVGSMFRPDNPLLPNYKHIPIGYHGRCSSIVVSGTPIRRPLGQQAPAEEGGNPTRGPSKLLDYELEVGCFIAEGNSLGESPSIDDVEDKLFGLCLLNDWSARDLQKWEYQPLGPFLAKSFASTISPWVVSMEALAPFRCPEFQRPAEDPKPLDYLTSEFNSKSGAIDLKLEVFLRSALMKAEGVEAIKLSSVSFTNMYWTLGQMVTHHSSNGCNLRPGDLLGSGTISGLARDSRGCLLELTWDGDQQTPLPGTQRTPIVLPTGEERRFLADGDEVIFKGFCESESHKRIGFGTCSGIVVASTTA